MSLKYAHDPVLLAGIMSALPKKMESSLNLHKSRLLGSLPKSRDDFDPRLLLSKMEGGEKIIVLDSNKDLPSNWRSQDLKDVAGCATVATQHQHDQGDGVSSDAGTSTDDDGQGQHVDSDPEYQDVSVSGSVMPVGEPKRVLVFTTMVLLGEFLILLFSLTEAFS